MPLPLLTPPRDGQLASETRPDGNIAAITYDTRGFPTAVDWSSNPLNPDLTPGFDDAGRLTSAGSAVSLWEIPGPRVTPAW